MGLKKALYGVLDQRTSQRGLYPLGGGEILSLAVCAIPPLKRCAQSDGLAGP